ncbi:hypothetical protein FPOAC2_03831 [Fusarium poae]
MTISVFHITIDGPQGMAFRSFPSTDLENGDPSKILLSMIRNTCCISNKLFFTLDGKSRIDDKTTLAYYMSLTSEGQKILKPAAATGAQPDNKDGTGDKDKGDAKDKVKAANAGVNILTLKVSNGKIASSPIDLPTNNDALNKLLDGISENKLTKGDLLSFTDRELASLKANYATVASSKVFPEPSEMTEEQWDKVFTNNRALHGYFYDFEKNIMVKARKRGKPTFKLKGAAPVGIPPVDGGNQDSSKDLPPFPPFYVADDANVGVTEIRDQFQHTLSKQGFDSLAVSASIGGGLASVPISVTSSFEKEHSFSNQTKSSKDVSSLVAAYNFPRVIVELDQDCLELTKECRRDALAVSDTKSKDKFFRDYGTIFASQFTLGDYLHSTRNVSSTETSQLDQVKDRTRTAAGFSIQSPMASASINVAKVDEKSQDVGSASLLQDVRLTWDAHGGDTLLCSNPPAWASTVKNYQLWRLMNQRRLVRMDGLIHDVDIIAYRKLDDPTADDSFNTDDVRKAVIHDTAANVKARVNLMDAFTSSGSNVLATKIQRLYEDGHYELEANIDPFNKLFKTYFPTELDTLIKPGTRWGRLTIDQKVGFGIYLASLGQVKLI